MYKVLNILLVFFVSVPPICADTIYTKEDLLIFDEYVKYISKDVNDTPEDLVVKTAKFFLDKPYVNATLEEGESEKLVVNLREFDCTTLVETCLALSSMIRTGTPSFKEYCRQLANLRYRNGKIEGYVSRLHYSSDWINENEKRGFWSNVSLDYGGEVVPKKMNFMSTHPQAYRYLKNNDDNIVKIREVEQIINNKNNYRVIPKRKISSIEKHIHNGDVILFATSINGLDYSHVGIACWTKGKLHFIHASSVSGKVVVEPKTLVDYCGISKKCTGISLVRLN